MIILSNYEVVSDLVEKRSSIYSDRVSSQPEPAQFFLTLNSQPRAPMLDL
jgi:hypothetical protein